MGRNIQIFFGPPGTGKTSKLIEVVSEAIAQGIPPTRIGLVSHTRRAIREVKDRVGLAQNEIPYFRTIHSMAFHQLGLRRHQVINLERLQEFSKLTGEPLERRMQGWRHGLPNEMRTPLGATLRIGQIARARCRPIDEEFRRWRVGRVTEREVVKLWARYEEWKASLGYYDFSDMLHRAQKPLDIDLLIVDEAQDTAQDGWTMLRRITPEDCRVVLAGDDDQSIFSWAGADGRALLRSNGERIVLPHSWRLPRFIKDTADRIIAPIRERQPKSYTARDADGSVESLLSPLHLQINDGSWLLLARARHQLRVLREIAETAGVNYSIHGHWRNEQDDVRAAVAYEALRKGHEVTRLQYRILAPFISHAAPPGGLPDHVGWDHVFADDRFTGLREKPWFDALSLSPESRAFIRRARRRGESLVRGEGKVRILTIHQAKGAEADHVAVLRDMPRQSHNALYFGRSDLSEAERRVWYVASTRGRHGLHWIRNRARRCFRG